MEYVAGQVSYIYVGVYIYEQIYNSALSTCVYAYDSVN